MRGAYIAVGWLLVAAVIWLSLTPSPPKVALAQGDKLEHLLAYGLMMFWFAELYAARRARLAYAALFVLMGVTLEFVQGWLGYRQYEVLDMFANGAGVLAGWAAALMFPRALPAAERGTR